MSDKVRNDFLAVNNNRINKILYECETYLYKGSYGGDLNLREIISIMKALRIEIQRIQGEKEKIEEIMDSSIITPGPETES